MEEVSDHLLLFSRKPRGESGESWQSKTTLLIISSSLRVISQFINHFVSISALLFCTRLFLNDVRALKSSLLSSFLYSKGSFNNAPCQIYASPEQS